MPPLIAYEDRGPKRRRLIPPSLNHLRHVDYSHIDPSWLSSVLLRLEYAQNGPLTTKQIPKGSFIPSQPPRPPKPRLNLPTWAEATAVRRLGSRLESHAWTAEVWARDVVGEGTLRQIVVHGLDLYLLGKEWPVRNVCLVGVLAAVEERERYLIYHVDDSTAVIQCIVNIPRSYRQAPNLATPKQKYRHSDTPAFAPPPGMEIGELVRVVGRVTDSTFIGAMNSDRRIVIDSIDVLASHNDEVAHHVRVAELHRLRYSNPFDLHGRLAEEDEAERQLYAAVPCSQPPTSSPPGSPVKRGDTVKVKKSRPLPHPDLVKDSQLNLSNLKVYIRKKIQDKFRSAGRKASRGEDCTMSFSSTLNISLQSLSEHTLNRPSHRNLYDSQSASFVTGPAPPSFHRFTFQELRSSRGLDRLADRIVQHQARLKRFKQPKKGLSRPAPEDRTWSARQNDPTSTGDRYRGSSVLPPPSRSSMKGKASASDENGLLVSGVELERAKEALFKSALQEMRHDGEIVLALSEPDEGNLNARVSSSSVTKAWSVEVDCPTPKPTKRVIGWAVRPLEQSVAVQDSSGVTAVSATSLLLPKARKIGWPVKEIFASISPPPTSSSSPVGQSLLTDKLRATSPGSTSAVPKRKKYGWEPKKLDFVEDGPTTPRKGRSPAEDDQATPRASQASRSTSISSVVDASSNLTLDTPHSSTGSEAERSTFSAWEQSLSRPVDGFTTEAFHFVTPKLIGHALLALTPLQWRGVLDEEALGTALACDERWERVAQNTEQVRKALEELQAEDRVRGAHGKWRRA